MIQGGMGVAAGGNINPEGVSTSISETTGPSTISLTLPRNWLRTLMAVMVMGVDSVVNNEGSTLGGRLGFEKQ